MSSTEALNPDTAIAIAIGQPSFLRQTLLPLSILFAGALAIRVFCCMNELWLDEVTSVLIARGADSPWSIFSVPSDNNHLLNSLYLYFVRENSNWYLYRIPSVVFGMGVVVAGTLGARRYGKAALYVTGIIMSCGFLQVNYSSEARGYAAMLFFAVIAFQSLERRLEHRSMPALPVFWISCALGLLAHLIFVTVYAALLLWSAVRVLKRRKSYSDACRELARCHAIPLAGIVAIYFGFARSIQIGGSNPYSTPAVLADTCALVFGLPRDGVWPIAAAALVVLGLAFGLVSLWRKNDDLWLFFMLAILVCPAALLIFERPEVLAPRYFLPGVLFFTLLLGRELGAALSLWGAPRLFAALMLSIFVAGNCWYVSQLVRNGRGTSLAALEYIVAESPPGGISIGSDHDFRNGMLVEFYSPYAAHFAQGHGARIQYLPRQAWPVQGPQWLLLHRYTPADLQKDIADPAGNRYTFEKVFPAPVYSGWSWAIYKNTGANSSRAH